MSKSERQREQERQEALFPGVDFDAPIAPQAFSLGRLVLAGQVSPSWAEDHLVFLEILADSGLDQHACAMLRSAIERLSGRTAFMESAAGATHVHVRTKDGGELIIHKSVRPDAPPGAWQVTRFFPERAGSSTMVPWGHRYARSVEDALKESWGEYGGLELIARKNPIAALYGSGRLPVDVLRPTWPGTVGYWDALFEDGEEATLAATDLYTPKGSRWQDPTQRRNPDARLRELERAYAASGTLEDWEALARVQRRRGAEVSYPPLPPWSPYRMSAEEITGHLERARANRLRVEATYAPGRADYRSILREYPGESYAAEGLPTWITTRFYVGRSTGRRPVLLRVSTRSSRGGDVLGPDDLIYVRVLEEDTRGRWSNNPGDAGFRALERAALAGDPDAQARYVQRIMRQGGELDASELPTVLLWWLKHYDTIYPGEDMGDLSWGVAIKTRAEHEAKGWDPFGADLVLYSEGGLNQVLYYGVGGVRASREMDKRLRNNLTRWGWRYETHSPVFFGLYRTEA